MNLADRIQEMIESGVQILYGEATGLNTVTLGPSTTPVTLPAIQSVRSGDYVAVLASGADRLILGPVGADAIQPWTPTITQGSAVSGTVNRGWYSKHPDGTFTARLRWTASGAGTASNAITIAMPVTLLDSQDIGGSGVYNDAGFNYLVTTWPNSTTACYLLGDNATVVLGQSTPTIASGDIIDVTLTGRYA